MTLPALWPNAGIENSYRKALIKLLNQISDEVNQVLVTEFRKRAAQEKAQMAMDGIVDWLAHVIDYLATRWIKKLDKLAQSISAKFVNRTVSNYEKFLNLHMRNAGFRVRFQITPYQQNLLQATTEINVGLIKSICSQYLERVQGQVWRCVTDGYDLSALATNLKKEYAITKRRAELIARDQGAKAHAAIERAKRQELGIKRAIWLHSHASKTPRSSHLHANGKEFDVNKGMYLDGQWVQPGELINCRCGSKSIIDGIGQ